MNQSPVRTAAAVAVGLILAVLILAGVLSLRSAKQFIDERKALLGRLERNEKSLEELKVSIGKVCLQSSSGLGSREERQDLLQKIVSALEITDQYNHAIGESVRLDAHPWAIRVIPGYQVTDERLQVASRDLLEKMDKDVKEIKYSTIAAGIKCK